MPNYRIPLAVRLMRRIVVDTTSGCHLWQGAVDRCGYGSIGRGGSDGTVATHTAAYEIANGPVPEGLELDHLCRNRLCCNAEHLEAVTHAENMRRAAEAGSFSNREPRISCLRGHLYAEYGYWNPSGYYQCRACGRERKARLCEQV